MIVLCSFHTLSVAQQALTLNVTGQPPLNTLTHDGFMDEVTREALNRIGYQLIIDKLPAERGLRNSNRGLIDGEMSRVEGIDKVYTNLVRVPEKIMDWEFCVFSKIAVNLDQGWNSLEDKNVAFITGWKILEENVPKTANITKTKNSDQLFALLERGRTDMIIYELWGGNYLINKLQLNDISMQQPALASREMFIYLHKKHTSLVPRLSQVIAEMKEDGSYEKLVTKHLTHRQGTGNP